MRILVAAAMLLGMIIPGIRGGSIAFGAADASMSEAYRAYKRGSYQQALETLQGMTTATREDQGILEYWKALCQSRLQRFEEAIGGFDRATRLGAKIEELQFERAQALYSLGKMRPAREAFEASASQGFKRGVSLYYQGYISQLLEEYPAALSAYGAIVSFKQDPEKLRSPALLQMAEVRLAQAQAVGDDRARGGLIRRQVIPAFHRAYRSDPEGPTGAAARERVSELQASLRGDVPRMINGVPVPERPWWARISQSVLYDSNVVTQADDAVTAVSNTASPVSRTSAGFKYEHVLSPRWVLAPDLDISYSRHLDRSTPEVTQNDSLSFHSALQGRLEHTWLDKPAALMAEVEFAYSLRDHNQLERLQFYSRSVSFNLGERFHLLSSGSTTLQVTYKFLTHEDPLQSAVGPGVVATQNLRLGEKGTFFGLLGADYSRARGAEYDRMTYRLATGVGGNDLLWGIDAHLSLDISIIDPRNQRASRGWEKSITPSLLLKQPLGNHLSASLSYSFTKYYSLDSQNYAHSRHVGGLGLSYLF